MIRRLTRREKKPYASEAMSRVAHAEAIKHLSQMSVFLRGVAARLTGEQQRRKPSLEEFSLLEYVCHLRDLELEGYRVRIERMLREDRPLLPDFDGAKAARYLGPSYPRGVPLGG